MSEKIVTLNEAAIKGESRELVRGSVGETLYPPPSLLCQCALMTYPGVTTANER